MSNTYEMIEEDCSTMNNEQQLRPRGLVDWWTGGLLDNTTRCLVYAKHECLFLRATTEDYTSTIPLSTAFMIASSDDFRATAVFHSGFLSFPDAARGEEQEHLSELLCRT